MGGCESPKDAMPWVGLYVSGASLLCTLAMAADALQGFRQWRLWFPCRIFTINTVTITLIAIAMKLPADLTTEMPSHVDVQAKYFSISFFVTMLGNFLPSLGLMGDRELLTNITALGILIITITVNLLIQFSTNCVYNLVTLRVCLFPLVLLLSVTLIVPPSRRILEHRYKELNEVDSAYQEVNFSYKELVRNVKKSWIMAETGNPQFVIACSPVSYVFGVLCSLNAIGTLNNLVKLLVERYLDTKSDYKWSTIVILAVQLFGVVLGSIAPIFRSFTAVSHFNISKRCGVNHLNVFNVEKYWIQKLRHWKGIHVCSHIPGRHFKIVVHSFKNIILDVCIALQVTLVVICKTISLVPTCFLILCSCCCYLCLSLSKRFKEEQNASESNVKSEIEEYAHYVISFEESLQLSKRLLKNSLDSITKLIQKSEKKEPSNLLKLLKKSKGFNGVLMFDNNQVPPLHSEENHNSWSLVAVTLTAIAISIPNIENCYVKELLASMREGLQFVRHIEENVIANTDSLIKARKASRRLWTEIEVYRKWLQIDLQNNALEGKTSKEVLQWLGDQAVQVVIKLMSHKNGSFDQSVHKFLAANSMYKISETILRHCKEQEIGQTIKKFLTGYLL